MATRLRSLFNAAHAPHLHPVQCTSHDAYKKPLGRVNRCHRHTSTLMGHTQLQSDGGIDNIASNLPASPLADGSFLLARTRWKRPKPEKKTLATSTKFQRQLARNPFAQVLASPSRWCPLTKARLPRDCLQAFKLMDHPESGDPWWVPPDLSTTLLSRSSEPELSKPALGRDFGAEEGPGAYALCRMDFLRSFSHTSGRYGRGYRLLLRASALPGYTSNLGRAVWRDDMEVQILNLMRRRIYEELLHLSELTLKCARNYLVPLHGMDDLAGMHQLGCVFTVNSNQHTECKRPAQAMGPLAGAQDIPFHNILDVLGELYTKQLCDRSTIFQCGADILLRGTRTVSLQKRVWKLQAYNIKL